MSAFATEAALDCPPESGSSAVFPELFHDSDVDWSFLLSVMDVVYDARGADVRIAAIFSVVAPRWATAEGVERRLVADYAMESRRTDDEIECPPGFRSECAEAQPVR